MPGLKTGANRLRGEIGSRRRIWGGEKASSSGGAIGEGRERQDHPTHRATRGPPSPFRGGMAPFQFGLSLRVVPAGAKCRAGTSRQTRLDGDDAPSVAACAATPPRERGRIQAARVSGSRCGKDQGGGFLPCEAGEGDRAQHGGGGDRCAAFCSGFRVRASPAPERQGCVAEKATPPRTCDPTLPLKGRWCAPNDRDARQEIAASSGITSRSCQRPSVRRHAAPR
jgi:hypothetical protein